MREGDMYEGFELLRFKDDTTVVMDIPSWLEHLGDCWPPRSLSDSMYVSYGDMKFRTRTLDAGTTFWLRLDTSYTVVGQRANDREPRVMEVTGENPPDTWRVSKKSYHDDGELSTEEIVSFDNELKREKRIVTRSWNEFGNLIFELEGDFGNPTGRLTQWHENGVKSEEGELVDREKHGLWMQWDEWGQLRQRGSYENGVRHGLWTYWDTVGRKCGSVEFKNGSGNIRMWHANGKPMVEGGFVSEGQEYRGWKKWYETGLEKTDYIGIPDGIKGGLWREWYESGQLKSSRPYDCGNRVGDHVWYRPDGEIELSMNGRYLIPVQDWFANGQLKHRYTLWQWTEWDEHDHVRINTKRYHRTNHGKHEERFADGSTKLEGQWSNGNECGMWVHYWPNGHKRLERTYDYECNTTVLKEQPSRREPKSLISVYRLDGSIRFSEARGEADTIQRLYYDELGHPTDRETYLRGKLVLINGEKVMR